MRKKTQIFRRKGAVKEPPHGGDQGAVLYGEYRVTGDRLGPLRIFAESAGTAEQVARRIFGISTPYEGKLEIEEPFEQDLCLSGMLGLN
jgi:hypothetical protein